MKRSVTRTAAMLMLAAAVLVSLTSCNDPEAEPSISDSVEPAPSVSVVSAAVTDHKFTIRYDAASTFNPITGTDPNNMVLAPLMYESLFVLNDKLAAEPVLCDSCTSSDGLTYTIKLKSSIAMSDGSMLNSADVKYTLTMAKQAGRFSGRLSIIDTITAIDSLTLKLTLNTQNNALPLLLDIPIIKANSGDQNHPAGTGPYIFEMSGAPRLVASASYRDSAGIPVPVIYLKSCTDTELSIDFSSQDIDMFWDDPADSTDINIRSDHEVRYYNTTILEYIGFNAKNKVLSNSDLRRALGLTVDRAEIIDAVYSNHAVAAPLVLSPNYSHYDPMWEKKDTDALKEISSIFASLGMKDDNSDGYLEIPDANGSYVSITLTFIVNKDNPYKVQAAQKIADAMKAVGINVTLTQLTWSNFLTFLQSGSFDLYYSDVSLPADYDLTALLSPSGALDFGKVGNSSYVTRINDFLGAADGDSQKIAAQKMCDTVYQNAPIIPVLYRQYAVHTNRNVVTGLDPTQSSLFYGLMKWKINLG